MLRKKKDGHLPSAYKAAHDLCFVIHDVLAQLLVSGEKAGAFVTSLRFTDEDDRKSFEQAEDIFAWLDGTGRLGERSAILATTVLPAALSDMLHCFYEALEASRKAKLNITYILLRKPIQETLYLFECIAADRLDFAEKLSSNPMQLRGLKAGGVEAHAKRIKTVLGLMGDGKRLDAEYIAKLRYDKTSGDSFDGICNHAMHLFTEHRAIKTEPLNINFIFSDWESKITQWSYLYSRLPYVLFYTHRLVEHVAAPIAPTAPEYLQSTERRIAALMLLWWPTVAAPYAAEPLGALVAEREQWLTRHCQDAGRRTPSGKDIVRMARSGELPLR